MNIVAKRLRQRNFAALAAVQIRTMLSTTDSFINGTSIGYVEKMYDTWKEDPKKVHVSWNAYFTNLAKGITPAFVQPPTLGSPLTLAPGVLAGPSVSAKDIMDHDKVFQIVRAYQLKGHEIADFDPLSKLLTQSNRAQH